MSSDLDNNDAIVNIASKTHVDSNGKIIKVIINAVPIALGAEHDLELIINSNSPGASIIMHKMTAVQTSTYLTSFIPQLMKQIICSKVARRKND